MYKIIKMWKPIKISITMKISKLKNMQTNEIMKIVLNPNENWQTNENIQPNKIK
jgi:hypothetical protein